MQLSRGQTAVLIAAGVLFLVTVGALTQVANISSLWSQPQDDISPAEADRLAANVSPVLVDGTNTFGYQLFSQLRATRNDTNTFISPFSIATALAMAYNGAAGQTRQEMAQVLNVGNLSRQTVNQEFDQLITALDHVSPEVELALANSLWLHSGLNEVSQSFIDRLEQSYDAGVFRRDFRDPATVTAINDWVNRTTDGMIKQLIDKIKPSEILFLLNAIHFKARWSSTFDREDTEQEPFTTPSGNVTVPMMHQNERFEVLARDKFKAIRLPYGGGDTAMYVFLPDRNSSLNEFMDQLTPAQLQNYTDWFSQPWMKERAVELSMPRFKVEYGTVLLNDQLKALGMETAFDRARANLDDMLPREEAFISRVMHKAVIQVDEKGTEAAAATGVAVGNKSALLTRNTFHVDRPFFFTIQDDRTDQILFMGTVTNPAAAKDQQQ
ncbi:MAG: serpin family protein [Candidatus Nanohaloarchaea archaeon]|nr:serpin family protein [Candidatus Nanohaloarchaea archaeon]